MDRTLILAHGKALALLASILNSAGIIEAREFGGYLGLLAVVTAETDPDQGDILAAWAALITDLGEGFDKSAS